MSQASELVGEVLDGQYEIVRLLGRGGMGVVYEGIHLDLARRVAVKVLFEHDPRSIQRFRQEALAAAAIHHPNVVGITAFGSGDPGSGAPPYFVMELLAGSSLAELLASGGKLPARTAVHVATQMLDGLDAAHAASIVHRDIKPSNVFLLPLPENVYLVKLLDFGIAKLVEDESGVRTTTGKLVGTPAYSAPEQLLARSVDARTDVHAVGLCLHEMLTGQRVFRGNDAGELAAKILHEPVVRLAGSDIDPALADIVERALAKKPEDRFPTARAMRDALAQRAVAAAAVAPSAPPRAPTAVIAPGPSAAPRPGAAPRARGPRSGAFVLGLALTLILGAVALGVVLRTWRKPAPRVASPDATTSTATASVRAEPPVVTTPDRADADAPSLRDASDVPLSAPRPHSSGTAGGGVSYGASGSIIYQKPHHELRPSCRCMVRYVGGERAECLKYRPACFCMLDDTRPLCSEKNSDKNSPSCKRHVKLPPFRQCGGYEPNDVVGKTGETRNCLACEESDKVTSGHPFDNCIAYDVSGDQLPVGVLVCD